MSNHTRKLFCVDGGEQDCKRIKNPFYFILEVRKLTQKIKEKEEKKNSIYGVEEENGVFDIKKKYN